MNNQDVCSLQEFIEGAIRDVIERKADSHIVKVDDAGESGYEHAVAPGEGCPCDPVVLYTDHVTGCRVYLHRTLEA
jgi:hypothetical protein